MQPTPETLARLDADHLLWIDVNDRSSTTVERLASLLDLPAEAREHVARDNGRARLTRREGYVILTIEAIEIDDRKLSRRELDLIAGPNFLVTVHDGPVEALDRFREQLGDEGRFGRLAAGSFLGILVDTVMSSWFTRIEEIEREIDTLDEIALRGPESEMFLVEVLRVRRRIALVRRTIAPHREAFAPLARPDTELDESIGAALPGISDRLERVMDAIENARELLVGSFDLHLGTAAHRSNEVMKVLTIVSAILLPAVVIAGVMGMNFQIPFFDNPNNFALVLGAMVVFAAGLLAVARAQRWI